MPLMQGEQSMQDHNVNKQNGNHQVLKRHATKNNSEEDQSSNFSFGSRCNVMNVIPSPFFGTLQDTTTHDKSGKVNQDQQKRDGLDFSNLNISHYNQQGNSIRNNMSQTDYTNTEAHIHTSVNEQINSDSNLLKHVIIRNIKERFIKIN